MTRELVGHDVVVRRNISLNRIANKGEYERKLVVMFFDYRRDACGRGIP